MEVMRNAAKAGDRAGYVEGSGRGRSRRWPSVGARCVRSGDAAVIIGTGNPTPAYTSAPRGEASKTCTCALVAINVDTGKMAWYTRRRPTIPTTGIRRRTPVLVDLGWRPPAEAGADRGAQRLFFVVDRVTGEHLLTSKFSESANWARPDLNAKDSPFASQPRITTSQVRWFPRPTRAQRTGRLRPTVHKPDCSTSRRPKHALYYLTEPDPRGALGLGGKDERSVGTAGSYLTAIDYKTGKIVWKRRYRTTANTGLTAGFLTTAGRLLFAGDVGGNFVAYDPANGTPLWHTQLGANTTNAPETYMVDGKQYVLVGAGDTLYAFSLY